MRILLGAISWLAFIAIAVPSTGLALWPTAAYASYHLYSEAAGGMSSPSAGTEFFGSDTKGSGSIFSYGLFYKFTQGDAPPQLQFGLLTRGGLYTLTSGSAMVVTPYLVGRVQAGIFYLGVGASPVVWRQIPSDTGVSSGSLAALGEVGVLWPIVPDFDLGIGATGSLISTKGVQSPKPVMDYLLTMRFHFWQETGGGSRRSGPWDGFRYPFGIWK